MTISHNHVSYTNISIIYTHSVHPHLYLLDVPIYTNRRGAQYHNDMQGPGRSVLEMEFLAEPTGDPHHVCVISGLTESLSVCCHCRRPNFETKTWPEKNEGKKEIGINISYLIHG